MSATMKDIAQKSGLSLGTVSKYFNGGIAVHGSGSVPATPASHGCVRIPMHIAERFPGLVANGESIEVF